MVFPELEEAEAHLLTCPLLFLDLSLHLGLRCSLAIGKVVMPLQLASCRCDVHWVGGAGAIGGWFQLMASMRLNAHA